MGKILDKGEINKRARWHFDRKEKVPLTAYDNTLIHLFANSDLSKEEICITLMRKKRVVLQDLSNLREKYYGLHAEYLEKEKELIGKITKIERDHDYGVKEFIVKEPIFKRFKSQAISQAQLLATLLRDATARNEGEHVLQEPLTNWIYEFWDEDEYNIKEND